MDDIAIAVRGVAKRYEVFGSEWERLLHALWPRSRSAAREVRALDDISFEVRRGESVAVIGRNGGGKSTLLQLITGTLAPTRGEVTVKGRISALLELGSGFNPEYTGRDNVVLNGLLLGLSREEILRRFDEIAAFAEIGEALDRAVKTYSSGMMMRLAFAVQVLTDPEILVIDEALSVGDFFFQQKCFRYIRALRDKGVTLLFVSHDMATVRDLCRRVLYLREGLLAFDGPSAEGVPLYFRESVARQDGARPARRTDSAGDPAALLESVYRDALWTGEKPRGAGKLEAVAICDDTGQAATGFRLGSEMRVRVAFRADPAGPNHIAVVIRDKYEQVRTVTGSMQLGIEAPNGTGGPLVFELCLTLALEAGPYSFTVYLGLEGQPNRGIGLDETPPLGPLQVTWDYEKDVAPFLGQVGLPATARFCY
jgi:lipopolysaccharide transport system ATP-binding protein